MPFLSVSLEGCAADHGAIGLIAPVGITTDRQTLLAFEAPAGWSTSLVTEQATGQLAAILRGPPDDRPRISYRFDDTAGALPAAVRQLPANRYSRPSPSLCEEVAALTSGATELTEALDRIVAATAAKFHYDHPDRRFTDGTDAVPALSCGLTPGSCIDINTYLVASCNAVDIPAVYFAGYFFPEERGGITNDMHCWVVTWAAGLQQQWDIAHHMKMGKKTIRPGYNPKPGRRYAMSFGRGHHYAFADTVATLSHFSEPEWLMPDGSTKRARLTARLDPH